MPVRVAKRVANRQNLRCPDTKSHQGKVERVPSSGRPCERGFAGGTR
jgi:hypothetical protein